VAARVRKSRARRREAKTAKEAVLRDCCRAEDVEHEQDKCGMVVLRDDCLADNPLIIGLIAQLSELKHDDIAPYMKKLHSLGLMILGKGPGFVNQN